MKKYDYWSGILKSQHFYTVLIIILNALQIKNPNLISSIPNAIIIIAVVLSTISAMYLLITLSYARKNKKTIDVSLFILLTIAGNLMLLQNM